MDGAAAIAPAADRLKPTLARLGAGLCLSEAEAEAAFGIVMDGDATPAQIGALLLGMRARGETVAELAGAVRAMRSRMVCVKGAEQAMDVCGTGGDRMGTLNVSTAVAFVVAGAGVAVAKHGNRAASSRSGGADVLAALGVRLDPPLALLPEILREAGCVFLFAPRHHAGMRHAASVRAELGVRTLFNLLGPLANPAGVRRQLTGVFHPSWLRPVAQVLAALGSTRSWVVHGGGLDELVLDGPNHVVVQDRDTIEERTIDAAGFGLRRAPVASILGGGADENAACLMALLDGTTLPGPANAARQAAYRDTVLLNAGAALMVAGHRDELGQAIGAARRSLDGLAALDCLRRLRAASDRAA
jgi:anthranilate phosphoribosyltransferase